MGSHQLLSNEVKILNKEHWREKCLRESVHMLGYVNDLSRLKLEINMGAINK